MAEIASRFFIYFPFYTVEKGAAAPPNIDASIFITLLSAHQLRAVETYLLLIY
ncbi:hypothetical protein ZMTM_23100 [Methyloradius palustris]|uniref:Uncharacterized protein n=1 Tax=Methyloradius palustris TaxID=2778876 RepID=A0A8D5JS36_9PROT|nr:hypothetical protein ZMTM_23100 [Methyloradius palustris]